MARKVYTTKRQLKKSSLKKKTNLFRRTPKPVQAATVHEAASFSAKAKLVSDEVEKLANRQVLVIPSAAFLTSMDVSDPDVLVVAARKASGLGRSRVVAEQKTPMQRLLEERRRGLERLASFGSSSSRGLAWAESRIGARHRGGSRRSSGRGSLAKNKEEFPGIKILEGVGALIVDREIVDVAAMAGASGSTVLENVFVPLGRSEPIGGKAGLLNSGSMWHLENIDVKAARNLGLDGTGVLIGILDTGIDATHPEFDGKTVHFAEFDEQGKLVTDAPSDGPGHGTHVSGLAAGRKVGVAPAADLAVAAVLTYRMPDGGYGGYLAQILRGINWLLSESFRGIEREPGVDLINASLGEAGYDARYYATLATARLTTGTLMISAIGNSGPTQDRHGSPGNYDIVVGVGAIDSKNRVAQFSDWGTVSVHNGLAKPDLCAPGVAIWSSQAGGGYAAADGTSMASPIVAGAIALFLQQDETLRMNAPALMNKLHTHVVAMEGPTAMRGGPRGRLVLTGI